MKVNAKNLERLTTKDFPDAFLKDVTQAVFVAHKAGHELCHKEFDDPEAANVRGVIVRAELERLLRTTAERYGIDAEVMRQPGQPWYHTEVSSGLMVLTAATVSAPGAMVESSDYRRGLAEANPDQLQFETLGSGDMRDGKPLYVILTHSKSVWLLADDKTKYGHLPGSVSLVYPAADLTEYVHTINLMDRYPDIVKKYVPQDWTEEFMVRYLQQTRKSAFV